MSRIAFVAALEREVRPFLNHWRVVEREHSGQYLRFFEHENAVVVCGGMGPEAARRAAEAVIVLHAPSILYSVGYAGALDPQLKVANVLRPARVVDATDGSSVTIAGGEGVLVSSAAVAGPSQKARLREAFAAQAVDLEAASVARAAQARGVEFSVVKAVSDEFDFELPATDGFVDSRGHFRERSFAFFVTVRPWLWPRVIRLARNSRRATLALCDELRKIAGEPMSAARTLHKVDRH